MSEPITNVPVDADRAKAPWGRGEDGRPLLPMGAHWTDVSELVDQHLAGIQARVDQAQPGNWYVSPAAEAPDTVCTQYDGYTRTVGRLTNMLPGDRDLVLHAHSDLRWCLDMIAKLRARVAELEAERHSTNEALDDAVRELRVNRDRIAELEAPSAEVRPRVTSWRLEVLEGAAGWLDTGITSQDRRAIEDQRNQAVAGTPGVEYRVVRVTSSYSVVMPPADESADKLTRLFAPTQALREDPHDGPLAHPYRLGRDLPQAGGAS